MASDIKPIRVNFDCDPEIMAMVEAFRFDDKHPTKRAAMERLLTLGLLYDEIIKTKYPETAEGTGE